MKLMGHHYTRRLKTHSVLHLHHKEDSALNQDSTALLFLGYLSLSATKKTDARRGKKSLNAVPLVRLYRLFLLNTLTATAISVAGTRTPINDVNSGMFDPSSNMVGSIKITDNRFPPR